jgi:hypothetical protein
MNDEPRGMWKEGVIFPSFFSWICLRVYHSISVTELHMHRQCFGTSPCLGLYWENHENWMHLQYKGSIMPWKHIGKVEKKLYAFLTSHVHEGEWSALTPSFHWITGWVVPRKILDMAMKRKITASAGNQTRHPACIQPLYGLCYDGSWH